MDVMVTEPRGAVSTGNMTTVYTEAAADSGDVMEWRPGDDVRYWHGGDVTQWSDDEDGGGLLAAESRVIPAGADRKLSEVRTEQTTSSVINTQISDVISFNHKPTPHLIHTDKSEGSGAISSESQHSAPTGQTPNNRAAVWGLDTIHTDVNTSDAVTEAVTSSGAHAASVESSVDAVYTTPEAVASMPSTAAANTAVDAMVAANTEGGSVDEVDAVHPRLSQGAARRRRSSSYPAFVCDTCCHDTSGWQDCVDHAYRSGHGLAARCTLCRLPAIRCRRRGRPGVWHRCVVVDTVRKMGVRNVAALVAGSHLTAPRPWTLRCDECGAAFGAKTARLVRHVVERGHSVSRHCERCLFPVFVFALNDERREMHVCVGNSDWVRAEEGAVLATAPDSTKSRSTDFSADPNRGVTSDETMDGTDRGGRTSIHRRPSHVVHTILSQHHGHPNVSAIHRGEDIATDYRRRFNTPRPANGNASGHNHDDICDNGETRGLGSSNGSVSSSTEPLMPPASAGAEQWLEERTPSCVAI